MTYQRYTASPESVIDILNNALVLGPFPQRGLAIGKQQLVFSEPSATIDFPGDEGAHVSLSEFVVALREKVQGLRVDLRDVSGQPHQRRLSLARDGGFTIGKGGSANKVLGFSSTDDTVNRAPIPLDNVKMAARTSPAEWEVLIGGLDDEILGNTKR